MWTRQRGGDGRRVRHPLDDILLVVVVLALLVLLVLAPRALRRRRRAARLVGGPEDAWVELRDTVRDLGMLWPRERSPRQTADALVRWFGAPPDESTAERPAARRRGQPARPSRPSTASSWPWS